MHRYSDNLTQDAMIANVAILRRLIVAVRNVCDY